MSEYLRRDQRKPPSVSNKKSPKLSVQAATKKNREGKETPDSPHEPCGVHGGSPMAGERRPEPELEPWTETAGLGGRRTGAGAAVLRSGGEGRRRMRKGSERSRVARVIAAALARNRPRELLVRPPPSLPRGARRAPISPGRPTGRSASRADGGRRKRIFGLVPGGPHGDVAGFFFFLLEDDDDPLGFPFRPRRTGDEEAASTHPGDESQGGASMSVGECAGSAVRCATCTGPAGSSVPCGVGITVRLVRYDAAWRVGPAPARPALCLRAIVLGTTPDLLLRIFPLKPC